VEKYGREREVADDSIIRHKKDKRFACRIINPLVLELDI
jgi:hypothetical protein